MYVNRWYMYFSIDNDVSLLDYKYLAVVGHQGRVLWVPAARFRSGCEIDMQRFPFDEQRFE